MKLKGKIKLLELSVPRETGDTNFHKVLQSVKRAVMRAMTATHTMFDIKVYQTAGQPAWRRLIWSFTGEEVVVALGASELD